MIKLICKKKSGGCGKEFEIDETKCLNEEFMQCPFCGEYSKNHCYEGGENKANYLN